MKKLTLKLSLSVFILSAILLLSCNGKEKHTLQFNLVKGNIYKQNIKMDMNLTQTAMGQNIEIKSNMDVKASYEVTDIQNDIYNITMKYDAMSMSMDAGTMKINLDSNTPDTVASQTNMSPIFKAMIGIPVEMAVTKYGKVQSISGFDKMKEAMIKSIGNEVSEEAKQQIVNQLGDQFSDESMKTMLEQFAAYFPEKPVSVGDSWNTTLNMKNGTVSIKADLKITFKSVEGNIATLEFEGTVGTGTEGVEQEMQGMKAKVTLNGTQTGTTKIDISTGWAVNAEITQNLNGETEIMGMKIPQTVVNKISISAN